MWFDLAALVYVVFLLNAGAASIGKGLGGMLFSRFGRSSTATPQTLEAGKDGAEEDDKKATVTGEPLLLHSNSSSFVEPAG